MIPAQAGRCRIGLRCPGNERTVGCAVSKSGSPIWKGDSESPLDQWLAVVDQRHASLESTMDQRSVAMNQRFASLDSTPRKTEAQGP